MLKLRPSSRAAWKLSSVRPLTARRGGPAPDPFVARLAAAGRWVPIEAAEVRATARRGEAVAAGLDLETHARPGESFVLVARHESGALTFHPGGPATGRRRAGAATASVAFQIPVRADGVATRRGLVSKVLRVFVMKGVGAVADKAVSWLAGQWEKRAWRNRHPGFLQVTPAALAAGTLPPIAGPSVFAPAPRRHLLFVHGTFSHTSGAFSPLAATRGRDGRTLFETLAGVYEDRIFAFDHFTVSRSPEDNARDLLEALPARRTLFDVVCHSRGGLVLRHLVDPPPSLAALATRFELGRAALVAVPNLGTPLASPRHWESMLGWLGNLADLFPGRIPFAFGLVSEALAWLAQRVPGALPGLAPMAPESDVIEELLALPNPAPQAFSALASNYEPDAALWQRMADAGVDAFFQTANDLVVPTEGGWRLEREGAADITGDRIGCYGAGGNVAEAAAVHHLGFFERPATVDFLVRALRAEAQGLPTLDPDAALPYRGLGGRRGAAAAASTVPTVPVRVSPSPAPITGGAAMSSGADNILGLFVISSARDPQHAELLVTFRNARVVEPFRPRGAHWQRIIAVQRSIRSYVDGDPKVRNLPSEKRLREMGADLFAALLPGDARRLYDVARSLRGSRRLDVVFSSMIPWVADLPWEFAYDEERQSFLATEEVNFVRNVLTSIPADDVETLETPLRILVAVAQPLGLGGLSADEEVRLIRRGFQELEDAGLAAVTVLPSATPELLHRQLQAAPFDILHFIGHGEYDRDTDKGQLVFEDGAGGAQRVDSTRVREIVGRRRVRLVFLNACETGSGGRAEFNRGVAPALVAAGVPAVVANQYKVLDPSANTFAQHFYWALAQGRSVGDAAREARIAVSYSILGESIDWAVPVVYARNPMDVFCRPTAPARVEAVQGLARRRARRSTSTTAERVALWDVNHQIASLPEIADRLSAAQDRFAFEVVDVAVPLGTWRLERDGKAPNEGFLHGGRLRDRLRTKPEELGVARLFCITSFRLGDDEYRDLYLWDERLPGETRHLAILSLHGLLEKMDPPRFTVERTVANVLASVLSDVPEHRRGPKTCPLYFNDDREIASIAGRLAFDEPCRAAIRKSDSTLLPALEPLLRTY